MKLRLKMLFVFISFFVLKVYAQRDSSFIINEFGASINQTVLKDENTADRVGFGAGIYHSFRNNKALNIILGLEYNRTSQLKKAMYESHFSHSTNVMNYINAVCIPLTARLNFGDKVKLFIESGFFMDLNVATKQKGLTHTMIINTNSYPTYKDDNFERSGDIAGKNYGIPFGIGLKVPISKHILFIKADYKFGLIKSLALRDEIKNNYVRLMIGMHI